MNEDGHLSRFLSYVLRHRPDDAGLAIDQEGWADIEELICAAQRSGFDVDRPRLTNVVANNDKKRFTISRDGARIRAAQGHSTARVDIRFEPSEPPNIQDRKSTRLNSSHANISYAVFCLKKKKITNVQYT